MNKGTHDKEKTMRKILIVEEDVLIREKLSNLLRDEGYYVIAVKDRSVAINCLERESIEIMIIAEKIIQENGFELLSFAKQRLSNIVIIDFDDALCASSPITTSNSAKNSGVILINV